MKGKEKTILSLAGDTSSFAEEGKMRLAYYNTFWLNSVSLEISMTKGKMSCIVASCKRQLNLLGQFLNKSLFTAIVRCTIIITE